MKYFAYSVFVGVLALLLAACNVNESIDIPAGATSEGGTTVNGLITVGENAVVSSELSTVNGSIDIGKAARTGDLSTVNGSITVAEKAEVGTIQTVNGGVVLSKKAQAVEITTVNGGITLRPESMVAQNVQAVNGRIELYNASVKGNISNVNGGMLLAEDSVVEGDLVVKDQQGVNISQDKIPRIVIGPGSRVEGVLRFERPVELYVHETAQIGSVKGAEAIHYSSDQPPH